MSVSTAVRNPAILSYHTLRALVGVIALSLPFALAGGDLVLALIGPGHSLPQPILQRSISDYYYTPVGDLLVGSLFVIGTFLICSRGYDRHDEITGCLAGTFTLGVALFPSVDPRGIRLTRVEVGIGYAHTAFAALMFFSIAYFCLFLFRKTSPERRLTRRKRQRNAVYLLCGIVIVVCMCVMVSLAVSGVGEWLRPVRPLLCCESLATFAFGVAWLTKGKGILRGRPRNHAGSF